MAQWGERWRRLWRSWPRLRCSLAWGVPAYAVGIAALAVATAVDKFWFRFLGGVLLVGAIAAFHPAFRTWRNNTPWRRKWMVLLALIAAGAVLAVFGFTQASDVAAMAGVLTAWLAFGQLLLALRSWARHRRWVGVGVVVACAVLFAVGLGAYTFSSAGWGVLAMAGAVLTVPIGISFVSEYFASNWRLGPQTTLWGLVVLLLGAFLLAELGAGLRTVLVVAVVLFLLLGAMAVNNEIDAVVVVLVIAAAWVVVAEVAPVKSTPVDFAAGEEVILALGDSYSSGEGAERYYQGTNNAGRNECRRAPTAYPVMLAAAGAEPHAADDIIPKEVAFVACSGARVTHFTTQPQYKHEPAPPGLTQIEHAVALAGRAKVKFIVLTIGGNDARFGEIGRTCVLPGDCAQIGAKWLADLERLRRPTELRATYQAIKDRFPDTQVLVLPYPVPLRERGCGWSLLTDNEHRFLHDYTVALNDVIREAVEGLADFHFVAPMADALVGIRICDTSPGDAGANFLAANPVAGLVFQEVNPRNWIHNSFHPNARGHRAMCLTLAAWIQANPEKAGSANVAPVSSAVGGATTRRCGVERPEGAPRIDVDVRRTVPAGDTPNARLASIMGNDFQHCDLPGIGLSMCRSTVADWEAAQVSRSIAYNVGPLGLMAIGAWLIWVRLISRRRAARREAAEGAESRESTDTTVL